MQETRQRITKFLREKGQATVDELAGEVDLTPMAVRHHLNVLQAEKQVEVTSKRHANRPGRPVQIYGLTDEARRQYPQEYYQLTEFLLKEIADSVGPNNVAQMFGRIADKIVSLSPQPKPGQTIENRLEQVVSFLKERGFVVEWECVDGKYFIRHKACPYRQLAKSHQEVCLLDEQIIGKMLKLRPIRVSCIANDDSECTYCLNQETIKPVLVYS